MSESKFFDYCDNCYNRGNSGCVYGCRRLGWRYYKPKRSKEEYLKLIEDALE